MVSSAAAAAFVGLGTGSDTRFCPVFACMGTLVRLQYVSCALFACVGAAMTLEGCELAALPWCHQPPWPAFFVGLVTGSDTRL